MAKLPQNDPLRSLSVLGAIPKLSEAMTSHNMAQGNLFSKVTDLRGIVRPLDQEVLRRASGAEFIGDQLRVTLDQANAAMLGRGIASSAALSAGRIDIGNQALQQASLRIAELYKGQGGIDKLVTRWRSSLQQFGLGVERFVEEQQRLDDRTNDFVQAHGWPVPLSLPARAYRQLVGLADAGKREVNRVMTRNFRPGKRVFNSTVETLLESDQLKSRRPLIRQSLTAYRRQDWYLVINGLLPLVEGILVDYAFKTAPVPHKGRTQKAIKELREQEGATLGVTVDTLETMLHSAGANVALFEPFDQSDYGGKGEPRSLNRHAILHGAARRYGSEQNALRLLLLIAVTAESFDLAEGI